MMDYAKDLIECGKKESNQVNQKKFDSKSKIT
jgi:hypothetical protein